MGVRLIRFDKRNIQGSSSTDISDHDELANRDLFDQHPIYSITGLQEALNAIEDSIDNFDVAIEDISKALNESLITQEQLINERIAQIIQSIEDISTQLTETSNSIKYLEKLNFKNSKSVAFSHNKNTNTVSASVRIFRDSKSEIDRNAIQELDDGLFVPKFISKDSTTVSWKEEVLGESLAQIFTEGSVFSHNDGTNNVANATEASAWYWDESLQSFVQPKNTTSFTGFVTKDAYDCYTHSAQICSTDSDNDLNGLVIGYVMDSSNIPHTLTAVVDRGGMGGNTLRLFYNFHLTGQTLLGSTKLVGGNGGWNAVTTGITINVTKYGNEVSVVASDWNSLELNEDTRITIDLDDYTFGSKFSGAVKYGYCNQSQAYSFFQNISFISTNTASASEIVASVNISKEAGNGLVAREDGLFVEAYSQEKIDKALQSYAKKNELHSHGNKKVLDKITESEEGILLFNGQEIKGGGSDLAVSEKEGNAIVQEDDGIFVEDKTQTIKDLEDKILDVGQYVAQVENFEDTPVGHILSFMGTIPPPHYLMCDGAEYQIVQYQKLADFFVEQYGKVNEFGGDGVETFCVPSLNESITLFSSADSDIIGYVKCIKFEPTYYIAYTASLDEINAIKEMNRLLKEQNNTLKAELEALSGVVDEILGGLPNEPT